MYDIVALMSDIALENGKVYSWGDGKRGQLGHGPNELFMQQSPKCSKKL